MRGLIIAFAVMGSLLGQFPAIAADKLVIAQPFDALIWAPVYVARKQGYFEEEGLDVEVALVKGGPASVTAVLTGSAQLGLGNPGATMRARESGQSAKVVALLCNQIALSMMIRSSLVEERGISLEASVDERLKAMKGLVFAVNGSGSVADQVLRHSLRHVGLDPDNDVTITPIESHGAAVAAFEQGRIDGFVQGPPASEMIAAGGDATAVVDFMKGEYTPLANIAYVTLSAEEGWLAEHPELARKAIRAVGRALTLMHENPDEAKEAVRSFFPNLDQGVFERSWDRVRPAYTRGTRVDLDSMLLTARLAEEATGTPLKIDVGETFTNDYIE